MHLSVNMYLALLSIVVILSFITASVRVMHDRTAENVVKSTSDKLNDAMRFYVLATQLKYKIRSGWDKTHWNVNSDRIESIAEHIYGTCILALSIDSEFKTYIDINKVIKMLVLHELGEVMIGDITPFDGITAEEKKQIEHEAMQEIIGDLIKKEEYYSLLLEFDEMKTREAKFAHHCDKLEADIQAKVYQDMGCQNSLNDQENNVVFKSSRVQDMIKNGAKTAFDIWYEWDRDKYLDDIVFLKFIDCVKNTDTQQFL